MFYYIPHHVGPCLTCMPYLHASSYMPLPICLFLYALLACLTCMPYLHASSNMPLPICLFLHASSCMPYLYACSYMPYLHVFRYAGGALLAASTALNPAPAFAVSQVADLNFFQVGCSSGKANGAKDHRRTSYTLLYSWPLIQNSEVSSLKESRRKHRAAEESIGQQRKAKQYQHTKARVNPKLGPGKEQLTWI